MTAQDDRQRRLTRDALAALAGTDFALAGAGAIREHGITDRPTQDIDLFTASIDPDLFTAAVDRLGTSLTAAGYAVETLRRAATFARLEVRTSDGAALEVDLAADWRSTEAVTLAVGPVLARADAVGSKLGALDPGFDRRAFAGQLDLVGQVTDGAAERYGVTAEQLAEVRQRMTAWAQELFG